MRFTEVERNEGSGSVKSGTNKLAFSYLKKKFRLSDEFVKTYPNVQQVWVQTMLRAKGWIVPNYGAPPEVEKIEMLRVVGALPFYF